MTYLKDGGWVKSRRMGDIAAHAAQQFATGANINMDKFVAWVECTMGLSTKKAKSYIETVALAKDWTISDGVLLNPKNQGKLTPID